MTRWLIAVMQSCLIGMLASCSPTPRHVVVYVSTDEHIARPILEAFEAKTGIAVYMVGDTEVRKTTGLLDRIRAERGRPVADVLWSSWYRGPSERRIAGGAPFARDRSVADAVAKR